MNKLMTALLLAAACFSTSSYALLINTSPHGTNGISTCDVGRPQSAVCNQGQPECPAQVLEPGSLALVGLALVGIAILRRR